MIQLRTLGPKLQAALANSQKIAQQNAASHGVIQSTTLPDVIQNFESPEKAKKVIGASTIVPPSTSTISSGKVDFGGLSRFMQEAQRKGLTMEQAIAQLDKETHLNESTIEVAKKGLQSLINPKFDSNKLVAAVKDDPLHTIRGPKLDKALNQVRIGAELDAIKHGAYKPVKSNRPPIKGSYLTSHRTWGKAQGDPSKFRYVPPKTENPTGLKGLWNKALGWIKKNPKTAIFAAVATAVISGGMYLYNRNKAKKVHEANSTSNPTNDLAQVLTVNGQMTANGPYSVANGDNVWVIARENLVKRYEAQNPDAEQEYNPTDVEILRRTEEIMRLNDLHYEKDNYRVIIQPGQSLKLS